MHSLRRAALSSVFSATRAVAQRSSATPFASSLISQYGRSQSVIKSSSIPVARFLSGTARVANVVEDRADDLAVEDAVKAAAETGSTSVEGEDAVQSTSSSGSAPSNWAPARDAPNLVLTERPDEAPRYREGETGYGIFVRNIVFDVTEAQLAEHFERYGPIAKAAVARDARGLSRGFGFVFFNDQEAATRAVSEIDGSFWNGRRVNVQPRTKPLNKQRPRVDQPTTSIYIGNIPYETTDAELNRLFRGLENVDDVRVAVDRTTGWPRGFAHADFTDVESAVRAFNKLSGTTIGGRELRLDYAQGLSQRRRNPNTGGGPGTPLAGSS